MRETERERERDREKLCAPTTRRAAPAGACPQAWGRQKTERERERERKIAVLCCNPFVTTPCPTIPSDVESRLRGEKKCRTCSTFTPRPKPHEHRGGLQGRGGLTAPHAPGKKRERERERGREGGEPWRPGALSGVQHVDFWCFTYSLSFSGPPVCHCCAFSPGFPKHFGGALSAGGGGHSSSLYPHERKRGRGRGTGRGRGRGRG